MPYLIQSLEISKENIYKLIYKLELGVNKIGRHLDSHIVLSEQTVSRQHAEIIVKPDIIIVRDCQSKNHTYVNNCQIVESVLKEGDLISFGQANFHFKTFNKREQALKNQIKELQIQIDSEQRTAEVEEVIGGLNLELLNRIAEKWKNSIVS